MELYAREFGQGSPVVILHGLFGFSDNWQTVAKQLSEHHLVITPDLRNHGRSPHVPTHNYPEMAEDLRAFLEAHWIFHTAIVGHSMGGKVAMQLAMHHPDMVTKLVVVDMEPGQSDDNQSSIFKALLDMQISDMKERKEAEAFLLDRVPDLGTRQFLLKNITRNDDGGFEWKMNLPVLWENFDNILAPVDGEPFDKPALFIRGSRSNYIRDHEWPGVLRLFPQAQLITIPDAGHWVHADQPAALIEALRAFLSA
jgi:esterase